MSYTLFCNYFFAYSMAYDLTVLLLYCRSKLVKSEKMVVYHQTQWSRQGQMRESNRHHQEQNYAETIASKGCMNLLLILGSGYTMVHRCKGFNVAK